MASAQAARRKAAVDEFADGILAQQDIDAAALVAREGQIKATASRRRQQLQSAREDVDRYSIVVDEMETALDQFGVLEKERSKIAARLLHVPGLAVFLASASWTRRLGDHLSRRLFGMYRTNSLGRIALNAGGNYLPSSLAGAERASLTRLLDYQMENKNGI